MPLINGTSLTARRVNTAMSAAFVPRAHEMLYPRVCGSYITTSLTETHAIGGAAPHLKRYRGTMYSKGIPSWFLEIPNPLHYALINISRQELVGDQTKTLVKKIPELGINLANYPDELFMARLLKGGRTSSATDTFNGKTYNVTMDGLPFFGQNHVLDGVTSQSNIVQGTLPATLAGLAAQGDIAVGANQMTRDLQAVIGRLKTVKDNQGFPIMPQVDMKKNVVVMLPSSLEVYARTAWGQAGVIGGSSGSTGSTTAIGPQYVKDIIVSGLLDGFPDPEGTTQLTPAYPTSYYVAIVSDVVKPFYVQMFKPPADSDLIPKGYDIDGIVDKLLRASKSMGMPLNRDVAVMYTSTLIEHNLNAVGSNAQRDATEGQEHFVSAQWRGNIVYGPWFTCYRVDPVGASGIA